MVPRNAARALLLLAPIPSILCQTESLLFNGAQSSLFDGASPTCLGAFNTSLECSGLVQLLGYDLEQLSWSQDDLSILCTSSCNSSLNSLASAVSFACGEYEINFNGGQLSAVQIVDFFGFKWNYSCLTNTETNEFCLLQERTWNITELNNTGQATWPLYTNKSYPNWYLNDDGSPALDWDESVIQDPFEPIQPFQYPDYELQLVGADYFQNGSDSDYTNYGWLDQLEYDEYPLEIQCQSCFIDQFLMGIQSQWGEVYE